jgi:hypothetical protein
VKLLLDMNLSPAWAKVLEEAGFETVHWSQVGKPTAPELGSLHLRYRSLKRSALRVPRHGREERDILTTKARSQKVMFRQGVGVCCVAWKTARLGISALSIYRAHKYLPKTEEAVQCSIGFQPVFGVGTNRRLRGGQKYSRERKGANIK